MAQRFYAAAGRILLSKPGFDAFPSMAEDGKLFDSAWPAMGRLITTGLSLDTSAIDAGDVNRTTDSSVRQVLFPFVFRYIPLFSYISIEAGSYPGNPIDTSYDATHLTYAPLATVSVTTSALSIQRRSEGGGKYQRAHTYYWVYGI